MKLGKHTVRTLPGKQSGFSMVELMVAVTIGLILLAGVSSILVSTKKSYNTQDANGRMQENARIAMMILTRELRNAGYIGCNINPDNITNVLNGGASSFDYNLGTLLEGSESGGDWQPSGKTISSTVTKIVSGSPVPVVPRGGTDLFLVRGAESAGSLGLSDKMNKQAADLHVAPDSGIQNGEILMLSDCSSTDIFQATNVNTSSGTQDNIVHNTGVGSPGNRMLDKGAKLSKTYGTDSTLMRFKSSIYYIDTGASGEPALWRRRVSPDGSFTNEELVEGIENLQVLYGEDTSPTPDRVADVYRKADLVSNWSKVVSVRFGIISRALANLQTSDRKTANKALDTKPLDVDGDGADDFLGNETTTTTTENGTVVKDRLYDRRMFRTTILLRNFVNKET